MSTVKPPPPPLSPTAPRMTPGAPLATALHAPKAVHSLDIGQSLEATRLNPAPTAALPKGTIQVQTPLGPLTLQTSYPIPKGAILSLVLLQQEPQPQFQIATINGKRVVTVSAPAQSALQTPPLATALRPGQTLNATLLRPALVTPQQRVEPQFVTSRALTPQPTAAAASPTPPQAVIKATNAASATNVSRETPPSPLPTTRNAPQIVPRSTIAPALGVPSPNTSSKDAPQTSVPTPPSAKGASPVVLPTGTRLRLTVQRLDAPNAAVSTAIVNGDREASPALRTRALLTGTLTGRTQQGLPIVQTPSALFALDARTTSLDGTRVTLRLDSVPQPPGSPPPLSPGRSEDPVFATKWSNLNEALNALASADPQRLIQVARHALPQPGAKLGAQMLFFLSALRGGDVRSLFGDTASRIIDKKRPGLLSRLNGDFRTMAKHADMAQTGDWRLALVPMWNSTQLEQVRFYWRRANEHDEFKDDGEETRFVLDVDLSRMGHLQIDGLLTANPRSGRSGRHDMERMDLIIRTAVALPVDFRREIADIFDQGRALTGFTGTVSFQTGPANFVQFPEAQTPQPTPGFYA